MTKHVSIEKVNSAILLVRGQKVMLDADLAELYGVQVKALNQAVRRNPPRFPDDFMFQLSSTEATRLRSQIVTLETGRGRHRKYRPLAFTEQGVAMLSSVVRSPRAVHVNIEIMRAFVRFRMLIESNALLAKKLAAGRVSPPNWLSNKTEGRGPRLVNPLRVAPTYRRSDPIRRSYFDRITSQR